jgi:hypothetical protein
MTPIQSRSQMGGCISESASTRESPSFFFSRLGFSLRLGKREVGSVNRMWTVDIWQKCIGSIASIPIWDRFFCGKGHIGPGPVLGISHRRIPHTGSTPRYYQIASDVDLARGITHSFILSMDSCIFLSAWRAGGGPDLISPPNAMRTR